MPPAALVARISRRLLVRAKELSNQFDGFLASQVLIPQIPRLLGPGLNKAGKFPTLCQHRDSLENKVTEMRSQVKFQLKARAKASEGSERVKGSHKRKK